MSAQDTVYAVGHKPPDFRDYMWLYTAGEPAGAVVDGAPVGPNGRSYEIPMNKATRVPWEAGRFILAHLSYTGVVRVGEVNRTDKDGNVIGTDLDIDAAHARSLELLEESDRLRWANYVQYVIDDKLNNKKVVPPPPDSIKRIMDRRGFKLGDFGISTPGTEVGPTPSAELAALKTENAALKTQLGETNAKLDKMLAKFNEVFDQ